MSEDNLGQNFIFCRQHPASATIWLFYKFVTMTEIHLNILIGQIIDQYMLVSRYKIISIHAQSVASIQINPKIIPSRLI